MRDVRSAGIVKQAEIPLSVIDTFTALFDACLVFRRSGLLSFLASLRHQQHQCFNDQDSVERGTSRLQLLS